MLLKISYSSGVLGCACACIEKARLVLWVGSEAIAVDSYTQWQELNFSDDGSFIKAYELLK